MRPGIIYMHIANRVALVCAVIITLLVALPPRPALAQETAKVWIQLESKDNILETRDRARFFARSFPDTHAFLTESGWYAVAIGPMDKAEAKRQLARLKAAGMIPQDSFLSDGKTYLTQLWPLVAAVNIPTTTRPPKPNQPAATPPQDAGTGQSDTQQTAATTPTTPETTTAPAPARQDAPVITPTQPLQQADQPVPDPDLKATRRAERKWSREQKKLYQTWLTWTGDYDAAIDGSYGPGTRRAIKAFQQREGFQPTGYLTQQQIDLLKQRHDEALASLGVETMHNEDAGIEILYPSKLVTFDRFDPPFVRYKPKDGSGVSMMLISQQGGRDMLRGLYDIMETFDTIPPKGYRKLRRDWFVLTGRDDRIVSYTYARTNNGLIKGFSLVWPVEKDRLIQPLVSAMYDSFTPLDEFVLDENLGTDQAGKQPVDLSKGMEITEPDRAATAFFINSDGTLLTEADNIYGCARLSIGDGTPVSVVYENSAEKLAILKPANGFTPPAFALFSDKGPKIGTKVTVSGFSFPDVMEAAALNYGTVTDLRGPQGEDNRIRVSAFLERGDVGGPVLDERGAVLGMALPRPSDTADMPEYVNFALTSKAITDALNSQQIRYGIARTTTPADPVDLAYMAADFTAKLACWKK